MEHPHSLRRIDIYKKVTERVVLRAGSLDTDCWIWTGPHSGEGRGGGYPRMCLDGQTVAVHKVMAVHAFGYIPGRKQVDHICRNRMCVNPNHLEVVTHKQNMKRRDTAKT